VGFRVCLEGYGEEKSSLNPKPSSPYSLNINYTNSLAWGGVCKTLVYGVGQPREGMGKILE